MKSDEVLRSTWVEFVALVMAFIGAAVSMVGALAVFTSQAQAGAPVSMWPLPGLILVMWAVLGLFGFAAAYLAYRQSGGIGLRILIFITGMFIPLFILGAFSIGVLVFIGFVFFAIATLIFTLRTKARLLESFGLLMLGAILNLGLLFLIITLGNLNA